MILSGDESTITLSPKGVNFIVPPYKATEIGSLTDGFLNKNDLEDDVNKIKNFAYTYISTHWIPLENEKRQKGKFFWHMNTYTHNERLAFPSIT